MIRSQTIDGSFIVSTSSSSLSSNNNNNNTQDNSTNKQQPQKKNSTTTANKNSNTANITDQIVMSNLNTFKSSSSNINNNTVVKGKRNIQKKSSSRKNYKKLKSKLKGLIEEQIVLKETLKRKQDQLVEMSRDIHYVLGRLLPYEHKLLKSSATAVNSTSTLISCSSSTSISSVIPTTNTTVEMSLPSSSSSSSIATVSKPMILSDELPSDSQQSTTWDYVSSNESTKSRINFPLLTLPDDIFSES